MAKGDMVGSVPPNTPTPASGRVGPTQPPVTTAPGMPNVSAGGGDISQQVSSYFKSRGVADTETPYWTQKWQEFGAKDPAYFNQRLSQADIFGGNRAQPQMQQPMQQQMQSRSAMPMPRRMIGPSRTIVRRPY